MATGNTVVVTGASGFLGRHVCERLIRGKKRVRGLARTAGAPLAEGVERVTVPDFWRDRDGLARAFAGADAVVHLAARVHVMDDTSADPLAEFRRVNVEGTRIVMEEAVRAAASTFVFASSVKAVGESTDIPWNDETVPAPVDPYGVSKLEAERMIAAMAAGTSTRICVLRLPLLYGPDMKGNMRRLFELVDRGWPLPFGAVRNRRALAYVGNVAAAVETAVDHPGAFQPGPFFVSDGADVSTAELINEISRALVRPARLLPIPPAAMRAAGLAGDLLSSILPAPFTTAHANRLLGSLPLDSGRFGRVTGFQPPFTLRQGIEETAQWYRRVTA